MNNFLKRLIWKPQKKNPPPDEGWALDKNRNFLTDQPTLTNSKTISKGKNSIGPDGRTNAGWWGYPLSLLLRLKGAVMEDKILPHDYDSEGMLLAALFCPGAMQKANGLINPDDFYSGSGKLIFSKMLEFHNSGRGFTLSIIDQAFEGHSQYINIRRALDMLVPVTAETVPHFASIVQELADRRRAIKATYTAYEKLYDLSNSIGQISNLLKIQASGLLTNWGSDD